MHCKEIRKPSIILDEKRCRHNIKKMAIKARNSGVMLRPHFKTHQSLTVGQWFSDENVNAITVSSVTMAKHFGQNGWKDITIAFPLNIREIQDIELLSDFTKLNLLTPSPGHLDRIIPEIKFEAGCFIELNTGHNRSGVEWNDRETILRMVEKTDKSSTLRFSGFLIHDGHTYHAGSKDEVISIHNGTLRKTEYLRNLFSGRNLIISTGDTPSCSIVNDFSGFEEIRPGNFVFYDLTQAELGSCSREQVAIAVACPVVDKNYRRDEIVLYGGGVHLSKDRLILNDGRTVYGEVVIMDNEGWHFPPDRSFIRSLSQEHGIVSANRILMDMVEIGDLLGVIPVHSCMTADLLREYYLADKSVIKDLSPK